MENIYETVVNSPLILTVIGGILVYFAGPAIRRLLSNFACHLQVLWFRCLPTKAICKLKGLGDDVKGIAQQLDDNGEPDREALDGLAANLRVLRIRPPGICRFSGPRRLHKEIKFLQNATNATNLLSTVNLLAAVRSELNDLESELNFVHVALEKTRQAMLKQGSGDLDQE